MKFSTAAPALDHQRGSATAIHFYDFHSNHYLRINQRRLEHLASLGLPLSGRTVLELGAGIGDLSTFFLDRGNEVTSVEARAENIECLRENIAAYYGARSSEISPRHRIVRLDLDKDDTTFLGQFDIVHCYEILYHLRDPSRLIRLWTRRAGVCVSWRRASRSGPRLRSIRLPKTRPRNPRPSTALAADRLDPGSSMP